jgi:hypothetical protein
LSLADLPVFFEGLARARDRTGANSDARIGIDDSRSGGSEVADPRGDSLSGKPRVGSPDTPWLAELLGGGPGSVHADDREATRTETVDIGPGSGYCTP